jgi:hypothetical protein
MKTLLSCRVGSSYLALIIVKQMEWWKDFINFIRIRIASNCSDLLSLRRSQARIVVQDASLFTLVVFAGEDSMCTQGLELS